MSSEGRGLETQSGHNIFMLLFYFICFLLVNIYYFYNYNVFNTKIKQTKYIKIQLYSITHISPESRVGSKSGLGTICFLFSLFYLLVYIIIIL